MRPSPVATGLGLDVFAPERRLVFSKPFLPQFLPQVSIRDLNVGDACDDAELLARHANNRKIWLGVRDLFPHPYTIQDAHEFLNRAISEQAEMKFCIEIDGTAIGGIGVHPGQDVHRHTATVGY